MTYTTFAVIFMCSPLKTEAGQKDYPFEIDKITRHVNLRLTLILGRIYSNRKKIQMEMRHNAVQLMIHR